MDVATQAQKVLKSIFGYSSFRKNQESIISAILAGQDVFTSMPTGGGKSLCYQIPSLIFEGLTIVISPLIALMKDQVDDALSKGISAAFINSSQAQEAVRDTYSRLYKNEISLLYISPERLALEGYLSRLHDFNVSFFAIDEAHCLSEWGHDFRPDYLFLSQIRDNFPNIPIAAFTATATQKVQDDIINRLKLNDPYSVRASFNRKELYYEVRPKTEILAQIAAFAKDHREESGIVYRISRRDVEKTAEYLRTKGIKAIHYHAGLSKDERTKNQELFNDDEVEVIVATTAFGMGINKSNIRYVLHGDLPKSIEGYYQETGRAGRDGLSSSCMLFFGRGDIAKQQYFIEQIEDLKEQEKAKNHLDKMVRLASIDVCRRKQILEYFNEELEQNCENCDVCNKVCGKLEATIDAQKVLSAITRVNQSFGINHVIDIVWGANTEKIRARKHDKLKTFGVGREQGKKWWRGIIYELIGQQAIFQDSERYNVLCMTDLGKDILYGKAEFFISDLISTGAKQITAAPIDKSHAEMHSEVESYDEILFKVLRQERTEIAREKMLPPYIIFSDKALSEMARLKPLSNNEFLSISGVGEKKLETYGPQFLEIIRAYKNS